jgi:hypothetical protein
MLSNKNAIISLVKGITHNVGMLHLAYTCSTLNVHSAGLHSNRVRMDVSKLDAMLLNVITDNVIKFTVFVRYQISLLYEVHLLIVIIW